MRYFFSVYALVLFVALFFYSCQSNRNRPESATFFSLRAFFQQEATDLNRNNRPVDKLFVHNGTMQQKTVHVDNWQDEFAIFANADINKLAWQKSYRVDSLKQGPYTYVSYTALPTDVPIRFIQLVLRHKKLIGLRIERKISNLLYSTNEVLSYSPRTHYRVVQQFETLFFGKNEYIVDVNMGNKQSKHGVR